MRMRGEWVCAPVCPMGQRCPGLSGPCRSAMGGGVPPITTDSHWKPVSCDGVGQSHAP